MRKSDIESLSHMTQSIVIANILGIIGRSLMTFSFFKEKRESYLTYDMIGGALIALHWHLLASTALAVYSIYNFFLSFSSYTFHRGKIHKIVYILLIIMMAGTVPLVATGALESSLGALFVFLALTKLQKDTRSIFLLQIPIGVLLAILAIRDHSYSMLLFLLISLWGIVRVFIKSEKAYG